MLATQFRIYFKKYQFFGTNSLALNDGLQSPFHYRLGMRGKSQEFQIYLLQRYILKFITFIKVINMNTKLIYNAATQISLYLDEVTLEEIKKFIETFLGDSWQANPKLWIYICTAIVCQCKKLPAVQSHLHVPFGFSVEKLLKSYPEIQKQQFFTNIISVASKWPTCPTQFLHKLQNLKLSFRIFKKYRLSCNSIGQKLHIAPNTNSLISSLFWIIYLIAKHLQNQSDSIQIVTSLVPVLIYHIYLNFLQIGRRQLIEECISKFFTMPDFANSMLNQTYERYSKQFVKILNESYTRRYLVEVNNFNFLLQRPAIIQRLIDDLSHVYLKTLEESPQFSLDQMSFLSLRKDMTPQGFHQKIDKNGIIISEKISFDGEKGTRKEPSTPKFTSPANKISSVQETPLTSRLQNLSWIRNCVQNLEEQRFQRVQLCYEKYRLTSYQNFSQKASLFLQKIIAQFSPTCKDVKRRKSEIIKFFSYCLNIAIDMYKQQVKKIFQADLSLFSILCLCTQVFNFVYQAYAGNYSRYCQIFEITHLDGFWPINWFGYFLKLPKAVDDHVYELERKFLLKQIWYTDLGFKIITNHAEIVELNEIRMLERLKMHTKCRIDEICRQTIGEKMVRRIYNMVMQLIEKKPFLLKRNNIDQIIICSITACLSINEDSNKLTLEKIFSFYQKVSLSSQENKEKLYDKDENELNIIDFYNKVFLEEIDEILRQFPETSNFLQTPKRLQFTERYKEGIQMTPFRQKYKQKDSAFLKNKIEGQKSKYSLNLARNIIIEKQAAMVDQSEESSIQNHMQNDQE